MPGSAFAFSGGPESGILPGVIRNIIFDWSGTLVDDLPAVLAADISPRSPRWRYLGSGALRPGLVGLPQRSPSDDGRRLSACSHHGRALSSGAHGRSRRRRDTPNPPGGTIVRDSAGKATGVLNGGGAVRVTLAKLGEVPMARMTENAKQMFAELNRMGMTSYIDMGGRGFSMKYFEPVKTLAQQKALTMRVYYHLWLEPESPKDVDGVLNTIKGMKPFQGDDWFDNLGYGETVYFPLHDSTLVEKTQPSAEAMAQWKRVAQAVADKRMTLNVHAQLRGSIEAFLSAIEAINKTTPVKGLNWSFSHVDQLEAQDLDRLRALGMRVQLHSRPSIQGVLFHNVYGDTAYHMPPLRMVQDSGLHFGLGSDATAVTPSNPFYTLGWAVTGRMVGGFEVNQEKLTRTEALIAHTRNNAAFAFREDAIGSLQKGKYADLLVLDRDYMTVPAEQIKDIKPLLTMVNGKVVYEATK